jgi:hypothetical protein
MPAEGAGMKRWQDQQTRAISRDRRDRERQAQVEREATLLDQTIPDTTPDVDTVAIVGWGVHVDGTTYTDPVCLDCFPGKPGPAFSPIRRIYLAARSACTWCRQPLEAVQKKSEPNEK